MENDQRPVRSRTFKHDQQCDASQVSINARYLATQLSNRVVIQDHQSDARHWSTVCETDDVGLTVHSLHTIASEQLAISQRNVVKIYNIETRVWESTLYGLSRIVTAISWSPGRQHVAAGSIDGAVCVWNLTRPRQPIARCKIKLGDIKHIAWSQSSDGVLAVANDHGLYVWTRTQPPQMLVSFDSKHARLQHLSWSAHHSWTLLASTLEGRICVWDLASAVTQIRTSIITAKTPLMPRESLITQKALFRDIVFLSWSGEQTAAFLYHGGKKFAVIDLRSPSFGSIDWDLGFSHAFEAFTIEIIDDKPCVRMISRQKQRLYSLPGKKGIVEEPGSHVVQTQPLVDRGSRPPSSESQEPRTMSATPISRLKRPHTVETKVPDEKTEINNSLSASQSSSTLLQTSTPSLDIPRLIRQESDSPMPFLSPAIPAKRPTWRVEDSANDIALPDAHVDGYFGSFSSNTIHDSDSDDDAFDIKNSKDNTRLMPGGANVPLPRSCGAVFSNGDVLVIFRPPTTKPIVAKGTPLTEQIDASSHDVERTARLFPTFGNLFADMRHFSSLIVSPYDEQALVIEALGLDRASYNSTESWKPHSLSNLPALRPVAILPTMQVTLQRIQHVAVLEQELAKQYRVLVQIEQTGAAMCLANAGIAIALGCKEDALIWQTLSKIIEEADATHLACRPSQWADHPLGSAWLVKRLYALAESRASLQMLACITAVLLGSIASKHLKSIGGIAGRLAIHQRPVSPKEVDVASLRAVPSLRTPFSEVKYQQSPIKTRQGSALSSRGPSLPTTPRLDSSSSTPPWNFPTLSQSGSKMSLSSSMSPENTRSSFSAAVKSYAQSVSDKFASYGTSPPVRKSGPSPSELSSSLPGVGGSWTKSVSFASTTTHRSSTLALSNESEDDYDSDRTVEDAVVLPTRRMSTNKLNITFKNKDAFTGSSDGQAVRSLIPDDLLNSCTMWVQAYAERLRCWGLDLQAVEFDNIGAALADMSSMPADEDQLQSRSTSTMCSICFCNVRGLEQICPLCQHACHMACLRQVLHYSADTFECPTGCGCTCSVLSHG